MLQSARCQRWIGDKKTTLSNNFWEAYLGIISAVQGLHFDFEVIKVGAESQVARPPLSHCSDSQLSWNSSLLGM